MNYFELYLIVLLAYLPGLMLLIYIPKIWRFPILNWTFIGIFVFNVLGSINVFDDEKIYTINFDSHAIGDDLALLLIIQAALYYLLIVPYMMTRNPPDLVLKTSRNDGIYIGVGLIAILSIGFLYFRETGTFLLFAALEASLNVDNAYQNRIELIYGLLYWPIYSLGFVFLPTFISSYALVRKKVIGRADSLLYIAVLICFCASLSMGSKAGLVNFTLTLAIAYAVYFSVIRKNPLNFLTSWKYLIFVFFSLVLMILGYLNANKEDLTIGMLTERIWYRMFVTYAETMAAAISYTREIGFLGVAAFPTARGMLSHENINLPLILHEYISAAPGGMNVPFSAEAFISFGWPGVFLACPIVFGTLIALQEIMFRLTFGNLNLAFASLYSYMALGLSINGMFATLFTFMYPSTIIVLLLITMLLSWTFLKLSPFPRVQPDSSSDS